MNKIQLLLNSLFLIMVLCSGYGQVQERKTFNVYVLNPELTHQDTVIMPLGTKKEILKAGWTVTEFKNGFSVQRTLEKDSIITSKKDSVITIKNRWKFEHVKHTAAEPNKVYLNPVRFVDEAGAAFNTIAYIPLPPAEKVIFTHLHTKWSAITIPFTIRPAVRGRLNSQVTSEFKIGTSFSLNHDWEVYKNRRMDVKKNTYGFSAGLGFGLGRVPLNNSTTQLSGANYDDEEEGLVLFVTPGIGLNIRGFKLLGFYGWDIGLTKNTSDWNYNRKPYIGIGLGFDFWTLRR
ncbi:MAG: hypothetical protein ACK4UK_00345 [Flavobacterium sp.]